MEERTGKPYELKKLGTVIRLGLLAFLIGMIASALITLFVDRETLIAIIPRINPLLLTVPFAFYLAINLVDTLRLRMVLGQFDMRIGFGMGFVNSVIGILFNNVTPMNTGVGIRSRFTISNASVFRQRPPRTSSSPGTSRSSCSRRS